jgi:hypothetical protein
MFRFEHDQEELTRRALAEKGRRIGIVWVQIDSDAGFRPANPRAGCHALALENDHG